MANVVRFSQTTYWSSIYSKNITIDKINRGSVFKMKIKPKSSTTSCSDVDETVIV